MKDIDFEELVDEWLKLHPEFELYVDEIKRSNACLCCCHVSEIKCPHCGSDNRIFSDDPWDEINAFCLNCKEPFHAPYS